MYFLLGKHNLEITGFGYFGSGWKWFPHFGYTYCEVKLIAHWIVVAEVQCSHDMYQYQGILIVVRPPQYQSLGSFIVMGEIGTTILTFRNRTTTITTMYWLSCGHYTIWIR